MKCLKYQAVEDAKLYNALCAVIEVARIAAPIVPAIQGYTLLPCNASATQWLVMLAPSAMQLAFHQQPLQPKIHPEL